MEHKVDEPTRQEVLDRESNGSSPMPRKKGGVMNILYPPGPRPGASGRMKNHCRKFWWCDLLVIIILVLVIVLPIIFVAIPHKAQSDLNKSTLEVTEQDVTSPSSDGIHLKIVSKARSGSSFHPTIEGFKAGLHLDGKEDFLMVDVPEVKAEAETDIVIDQDVKFVSLDAFKEYNKVVMDSETFDVYLTGKTKIHQSGLHAISVDYNKKVTMKGLNKLNGLNITDLQLLAGSKKPLPDGTNMLGFVQIPNPSVMTLDLGNVTMDLSIAGTAIGYALLPDLVLHPGANNVSMQATITKLVTTINLILTNYKSKIVPLDIAGNSSVSSTSGQHLEYFEEAIKSNTIRVDLNVGPAMAAIGLD